VDSAFVDPLLGCVIAQKMELLTLLGAGSMGRVYRARHLALDKIVAIKVLHRTEAWGSDLALRFKAEARAASRLDHPNSLRILDFGEDGEQGLLYLAMEFIEGQDLASILQRTPILDPVRVADIMAQVLAALSVAHQQGVVHRDMKPGNVMLIEKSDDDGAIHDVVKVCDFGLAKILDANLEDDKGAPLTRQGAIMGTPLYMSPEQAGGETVDGLSDIYSCGVMLYQMLTGRPPFSAESAAAVLLKHIVEEPPPILRVRPEADARLAAIAEKAMAKKKDQRYPSARDMMLALRGVLRESSGTRTYGARLTSAGGSAAGSLPGQAVADTVISGEVPEPRRASRSETRAISVAPSSSTKWALPMVVFGSIPLLLAIGAVAVYLCASPPSSGEGEPPVVSEALPPVGSPKPIVETPPPPPPLPVAQPERTRPSRRRAPRAGRPPTEEVKSQPSAPAREPAAQPDTSVTPDPGEAKQPSDGLLQPPPAPTPPPVVVEEKAAPAAPVDRGPRKLSTGFTLETSIQDVEVNGGISRNASIGALKRTLPRATACLTESIKKLGVVSKGRVRVRARIDVTGQLRDIKPAATLNGIDPCLAEALSAARMPKPDTGEGLISFAIDYSTKDD
jgi:serine/threonine-protein kinase